MTDMHDTADLVSRALRRAWQLGQTYWQQADSEYQSHWKKADATQDAFNQLVEDTRAAILTANSITQPAQNVPDDVVEQAVNRFLSWKLPKDFHPDGGMVFIPTKGRGYDSPHWPVGTNLLNAQQAREMLRYVIAAAPETKP